MNRRQMKKKIPKDTDYCYTRIGNTKYIQRCPHLVFSGRYEKFIGENKDGTTKEINEPIMLCKYTKIDTEESFLLSDMVKVCGERDNYFE
ncbi:hypothetical protein [Bacillus sp. NPDC094106]|uniref:hypothetical protein n=1 Tax=Bacillus sp. NPDC094106 TaxID=3363949 RepID=UPI0037F3127E